MGTVPGLIKNLTQGEILRVLQGLTALCLKDQGDSASRAISKVAVGILAENNA